MGNHKEKKIKFRSIKNICIWLNYDEGLPIFCDNPSNFGPLKVYHDFPKCVSNNCPIWKRLKDA